MTIQEQQATPSEIVAQLLEAPARLPDMIATLSPQDISALVDHLKSEADRHWWINANRSLELADLIVRIGQACDDTWQIALGTMARGDALKFVGRREEAWELFNQAGRLFRSVGDEVGWARTRIGRLVICMELNRVQEALSDAELAREIFIRYGENERLFSLYNNIAMVYGHLGNQPKALEIYLLAQAMIETLGPQADRHVSLLSINMGYTYERLGDFYQAARYYKRAQELFDARHQLRGIALAEHNLAYILMAQGQHRQALKLLHHAYDLYTSEQLALDATHVRRDIVESYLLLNRYVEARDLAEQVMAGYHGSGSTYREAQTLLHLAAAEAHLGRFDAAKSALDRAEHSFAQLDMPTWLAITRLRYGQVALRTGATTEALRISLGALATFEASGALVEYGTAALLHGQALLAINDPAGALPYARAALVVARRCNMPSLRYSAHLLLGTIAEASGHLARAMRGYSAAMATIDRVQRGLTITLRPDFLDDKAESLHGLLRLYLRAGQTARAFETLEHAKSQTLLGYLANRERLRWAGADAHSQALIDELNQLREEHQWFYRLAHERPSEEARQKSAVEPEHALVEVATRERRMRAITEQLYLYSDDKLLAGVAVPSMAEVQDSLDDGTLMIEFYNNGTSLWAFTLDRQSLQVHHLASSGQDVHRLLAQLQANIDFALRAGPLAPMTNGLTNLAQRLLQRLYSLLLMPLAQRIVNRSRLVVVPYGELHYLPVHLLHDGKTYLFEQFEVSVLPAAALATRRGSVRAPGARILVNSWDGRLAQTLAEARIVQQLFGGELYAEQQARRATLSAEPRQILHIAAHGEHRLDQPDLSYIQLADGQLYTDDLLQHDLSYELVTLSACETGRANVAAGDELIGLGRGFLYAGAGALIASLWRVADDSTLELMHRIYSSLRSGRSKAAAMRDAQQALLGANPSQHPAFWGAFQLVGNPNPLSTDLA